MNVLVIGKGAREHALCWKIARAPSVEKVLCIPGSDGIATVAQCQSVEDARVADFARDHAVDLVVIGPEAPLVEGMADTLRSKGVKVFGPGKDGARLEGSKIFAKKFMEKHGIPTARFFVAGTPQEAHAAVDSLGDRVVIKADGLAAGKGVIVCSSRNEGKEAVERLMVKGEMGGAGSRLVIEERLEGQEVSIIAVCDGKRCCILLPTQDHKRVGDSDEGPNTGGMGAYAPAAKVSPPSIVERIEKEVVQPALRGLAAESVDFRGTLYCGLMIGPDGRLGVLEFNTRFGDPETQPQMLLLDEDLAQLLRSAASGELATTMPRWKKGVAVTVVLAAEGYPGTVVKGDAIDGLDGIRQDGEHVVFHAGTRKKDGRWFTDGGRVLGVTTIGKDLEAARSEAYRMVEKIRWRGMHFRRDIGMKGM